MWVHLGPSLILHILNNYSNTSFHTQSALLTLNCYSVPLYFLFLSEKSPAVVSQDITIESCHMQPLRQNWELNPDSIPDQFLTHKVIFPYGW